MVYSMLLEEGLIDLVPDDYGIPGKFERFTQRIPLLNRLISPLRIPILFSQLAAIPLFIVFRLEVPSFTDELTTHTWCIKAAASDGNSVDILSIPPVPVFLNNCREFVRFNKNGTLALPGMSGPKVSARWRKLGGRLEIYQTNPPQPEYEGVFKVRQGMEYMVLQSDQLELHIEKSFKGSHN